jgi:hypothetical protein
MKKQLKKDIQLWAGTFSRGLAIAGLTFFSTAVTTGFSISTFSASLIAGGLYMFAELCKSYAIEPVGKKGEHQFLVFP